HPAGDVDADRVRNHRVVRRQHAADRQAISEVGVGHQGAPHRDRELARVLDLAYGLRLEVGAPLPVGSRLGSERPGGHRSNRSAYHPFPMHDTLFNLIAFLGAIGLASVAAPRIKLPAPVLLAVVGLAWGSIPGRMSPDIDPHVVLSVFLPPLLYAEAWR